MLCLKDYGHRAESIGHRDCKETDCASFQHGIANHQGKVKRLCFDRNFVTTHRLQ